MASGNFNPLWTEVRRLGSACKGIGYMAVAQLLTAIMTAATKFQEDTMSTFEILFVRFLVASIICAVYIWWQQIPGYPWGDAETRSLVVISATGGFIGLACIYISLNYFSMAEASAFVFIAPLLARFGSFVLFKEPFPLSVVLASFVSMAGVLLILCWTPPMPPQDNENAKRSPYKDTSSTLKQVAYGLVVIPFILVNAFALSATLLSAVGIMLQPNFSPAVPKTAIEWAVLIFISLGGFGRIFFFTLALQQTDALKATNVIYLQLVFILILERVFWGISPSIISICGGALILGSVIYVALQPNDSPDCVKDRSVDIEIEENR